MSRQGERDAPADSRRAFLRGALAVGGSSALAACAQLESDGPDPTATGTATDTDRDTAVPDVTTTKTTASADAAAEKNFPRGPEDLSELPESQQDWVPYLLRNRFGNTALPQYHTFLFMDYTGEGAPTQSERETVESALETVDRAFQRGTGGVSTRLLHEGLLYFISYSPSYFDRFEEPLHDSVDILPPEEVLERTNEAGPDGPTPDDYDAAIHMCSGYASVVLGVEEALFGDLSSLNGLDLGADFSEVFELRERRTGFVGKGQPARKYDNDDIPTESPLSMGFRSAFADNLPPESRMSLTEGPFSGGTVAQISEVETDLEKWYDETDEQERVELMFTPDHDADDFGKVGEGLGAGSGTKPASVTEEAMAEDAREEGLVGHGQKVAAARDENFIPKVIRRDCNRSAGPGIHFDGWSTSIEDFIEMRKAMNGADFTDEVPDDKNGILGFIEVLSRGTYLIPPRRHRALPTPNPE